jgi:serine/threonine-protein kinase
MSSSSEQNLVLPVGLAARLDPVCDEFELAWLSGQRPQLEAFLPRVDEDDRPHLLAELLSLEIEQRNHLGEHPEVAEYHERLPGYGSVIKRVFGSGSTCQFNSPQTLSESPSGEQPAEAPDELPKFAGRYEIKGEIARGGMGIILRVRDPDLKRTLAVKVLRPECRTSPDLVRRFREEAQITGQLQHPCIPPIHEIGAIGDGQPFFAMKLIRGKTLAELLDGKNPGAESLPRFLGIFEQVCQAIAFAHSRDIIHRDLKPSNVMVGAFGEVQVMDWGLAKVLGRENELQPEDNAPGSVISTERMRVPEWASRIGEVIGTPAYMAPEQARGETDLLDKRCDVFGLGAILCVILTGKPPFTGDSGMKVRKLAMTGDLAEAFQRLEACGADPELVELTRTCLAPRIEDRLTDAKAVSDAVAAHLLGIQQKLRRTELERTAARLKAIEERKRSRLTASLAAIAIIAILVAGIGWKWIDSVRSDERTQTFEALGQELGRASALRDEAIRVGVDAPEKRRESARLWTEVSAIVSAEEPALEGKLCGVGVEGRAHQLLSSLRSEAAEAERDRTLMDSLDDARAQRGMTDNSEGAAQRFADAFRGYGIDVLALEPEQAVTLIQTKPRMQWQLVEGLDDWLTVENRGPAARRLAGVAARLDADQFRNWLREAIADRDSSTLRELVEQASAGELSIRNGLLLAEGLRHAGELKQTVAVLRRVHSRRPDDFWVNAALGLALEARDAEHGEEATGFLRAALAIRPEVHFVQQAIERIAARESPPAAPVPRAK